MEAYPLQWPAGWPRSRSPEPSRFEKRTIEQAKNGLLRELELMGASGIIISTNLKLRQDGFPYFNQRQPVDCGVAVYFKLDGNPQCFPCDRWNKIEHNMRAIELSINSLRGLDRWGAKEMVNRAFTGFKALPQASIDRPWWEVLQVPENATLSAVEQAYKTLARKRHPDLGGSQEKMAELNAALVYAKTCAR